MGNESAGSNEEDVEGRPTGEGGSSLASEIVGDDAVEKKPSNVDAPPAQGSEETLKEGEVGKTIAVASVTSDNVVGKSTEIHSSRHVANGTERSTGTTHYNPARANYIRDQLNRALENWWAKGELPPKLLLRDALQMLEAGESASESQRTLLLRAALFYDRGVQTALRFQLDAERVALVVSEALVEREPPLEIGRVVRDFSENAQLLVVLRSELERSRVLLTGEFRRRADLALEGLPQPNDLVQKPVALLTAYQPVQSGGRRLRQLLLVLLIVAILGFMWWERRQPNPQGMVLMPEGEYAILGTDGLPAKASIPLQAYFIDQFEVTNSQYRHCIEAGNCSWPLITKSLTKEDYFSNPAFNSYPVIGVTQGMAQEYCLWQERRLPTQEEWQAAASVSPTTGQAFIYPWGERLEQQRANSALTATGDTVSIGSYRPSGDSPSGASDMAGNVAEWTSSVVTGTAIVGQAIVKGGSFLSDDIELQTGAIRKVDVDQASQDVGMRCARSYLLTKP